MKDSEHMQIATVLDTWQIIMLIVSLTDVITDTASYRRWYLIHSFADSLAEPPNSRHLQHIYQRVLSHSDTNFPLAHSQSHRGLRALGRSHCHFSDPFLTPAPSLQTTPKPAAWTAMAGVTTACTKTLVRPSLSSKVESLVRTCLRYMLQDL